MNKQLAGLFLCLVTLVVMPSCRKCKKEKSVQQQEEINTMINIGDGVEEEEMEVKKSSIAKF